MREARKFPDFVVSAVRTQCRKAPGVPGRHFRLSASHSFRPLRRGRNERTPEPKLRGCVRVSVAGLFGELQADVLQHVVGHARQVPLGLPAPLPSRAQVSSSELGQLRAIDSFTGSTS